MPLTRIQQPGLAANAIIAASIADGTIVLQDLASNSVDGTKLTSDIAITTTGKVAFGISGAATRYANTIVIGSQANTSSTHSENIGVVGEATANATHSAVWGIGVYGKGNTNSATRSAGVMGDGGVTNTADSGSAVGVRGYSQRTHAGGLNIGLFGDASGSAIENYALYMNTGNMFSANVQTWTLLDNTTASLQIGAPGQTNLLTFNTLNTGKSVEVNGTAVFNGAILERANVSATGAGANVIIPASSAVLFFTGNATANSTVNLTGLSNVSVGNVASYTLLYTNNTTPRFVSGVQVDGDGTSNVRVRWSGGAPTSGTANIDTYSFSVIKTGATPTYTVLAQLSNFS